MQEENTTTNSSRREFLKTTSLASLTLFPAVKILANVLEQDENEISELLTGSFNSDFEFHVIDNNLLNLHFYFINVKKSSCSILSADSNQKSFMIVRLPQMHISEKGYWQEDWQKAEKRPPSATLSGYSYLAFQLWPKDKNSQDKLIPKKIKFTLENLLNWNAENNFELITLVEWFDLKNIKGDDRKLKFANYSECTDFKDKKVWYSSKLKDDEVLDTQKGTYYKSIANEPNSIIYKKYKSLVRHFLDNNLKTATDTNNTFIPITFLEFPQGAVLVPIARDENGALAAGDKKPIKQFWKNKYVNQKEVDFGYRKYEVWNNTLFYKTKVNSKGEGSEPTFKIETPSFRIAGLITEKVVVCSDSKQKTCEEVNADAKQRNILPSLIDKMELAFLTQYANDEKNNRDYRDAKYDIKEQNGLFFTGLGIITHLKYYNEDAPTGIDLIEYEHIITEGRDIFVKVARIGIHNKTGKRYKHVIEGKRKIETEIKDPVTGQVTYTFQEGATSFIELKQYCECIEKVKNYEFTENPTQEEWNAANFKSPLSISPSLNPVFHPATSNNTHYRRYPWKEIRTIEKKRIPIQPFQDQTDGKPISYPECALWFWPVLEGTLKNPKYLQSVFDADDWDNGTLNLATPFIFIRKSVIEEEKTSEINSLTNSYFKHSTDDSNAPINLRRKITINNQKIAFTKPLPIKDIGQLTGEKLQIALNESKSKTHILETEFIETYFNFSQKGVFTTKPFAQVRFPLLPQVLRAKVYVDHIRDLTLQKIPSIVEYHENYITHAFTEQFLDNKSNQKKYANAAKQILANTEAFIQGKEETINNKYGEIKNALQEAKDKLGNLAVPDIIPDTISLEKFGVTLPKNINKSIEQGRTVIESGEATLNKIASFNPRELLRGKLSDVCGLDLTAILDELIPANSVNNQTPLFEINKTLDNIKGEILDSPIYKNIVNFKIQDPINGDSLPPDKLIQRYTDKINDFKNTLESERLKLNKSIKELSNEIPNDVELDNLVKSLFEQYRTQAFEMLLNEIPFEKLTDEIGQVKNRAEEFFNVEQFLLKEEFEIVKNKLEFYFKDYQKEIDLLPTDLKTIAGININDYLKTRLKAPYYDTTDFCGFLGKLNNLFNTIEDKKKIDVSGNTVYYVIDKNKSVSSITYELTSDSNKGQPLLVFDNVTKGKFVQVENKINTLKAFVIKNINGDSFQRQAAIQIQTLIKDYTQVLNKVEKEVKQFQDEELGQISKEIENWKNLTNEYLTNSQNKISVETKDALIKVHGLISKVDPYIDLLRKCDPYFYYTEQLRLGKEINDIERRFKQKYYSYYLSKKQDVENIVKAYIEQSKKYSDAIKNVASIGQIELNNIRTAFIEYRSNKIDEINRKSKEVIDELVKSPEFKELYKIVDQLNLTKQNIKNIEDDLNTYLLHYKSILQQQATDYAKQLDQKVKDYIDKQEKELIYTVGADNILAIQANINEAKNIYRLLTSIKQQDLTYNWNTNKFRDVNLGIVSFKKFSNPDTTLKVDVKATTHFSSGKFPPVIERVTTYSENRFTNFGISFFNSLTVSFNEISFITGSDRSTHFDVKIKDVKFEGALSFVQAFESYLQTMGKGLILQLHGDHLALGYSMPIPAIKTPSFSFFNLSLNFDLRVYFDKRPLRFGFSLARPDSKFGITAGIYAGFGFFSIVADPKKGIVEIDTALEGGAWSGIRFGPFSGEVKLAFGFRYTKNEFGVRIEGYIVAEGRLSFWVMEVSARIYLGIVSQNSYVEGACTVTYSVKVGFVKKSFSGTFHKKIAGANKNNSSDSAMKIAQFHKQLDTIYFSTIYGLEVDKFRKLNNLLAGDLTEGQILKIKDLTIKTITKELLEQPENHTEIFHNKPVSKKAWNKFVQLF